MHANSGFTEVSCSDKRLMFFLRYWIDETELDSKFCRYYHLYSSQHRVFPGIRWIQLFLNPLVLLRNYQLLWLAKSFYIRKLIIQFVIYPSCLQRTMKLTLSSYLERHFTLEVMAPDALCAFQFLIKQGTSSGSEALKTYLFLYVSTSRAFEVPG